MIAPLHIGYDPLKLVAPLNDVTAIVGVAKVDPFPATAIKNCLCVLLLEFAVRGIYVETVVIGQRFQHVEVIDVAAIPAADRALG